MVAKRTALTASGAIDLIRSMQSDGLSVREIARRTGLGKSTVHDVVKGKYGVSTKRAESVGERVASYRGMLAVFPTDVRFVDPATARDRTLLGRYWHEIRIWRQLGDDQQLAKFTGKTIRLRGGERIPLITDPTVLRRLDDASRLTPDEILEGHSP